jgi:hypothetical protein
MLRCKLLLLGLLALLVPACSGDQTVSPPLLLETFDGSFPGTTWTAVAATGGGSAAISASVGNPPKALSFTTSAVTSTASTTTQSSFSNPNVTFTVQEAVVTTAGLKGAGRISIMDATPAEVAFVSWDPETTLITYSILGSALPAMTAPAADGGFHVFRFKVDIVGNASWSRDGAAVATHAAFPAGALKLQLSASFGTGTAWPEFDFDNVSVTSP